VVVQLSVTVTQSVKLPPAGVIVGVATCAGGCGGAGGGGGGGPVVLLRIVKESRRVPALSKKNASSR
jgi:hypothetical protein